MQIRSNYKKYFSALSAASSHKRIVGVLTLLIAVLAMPAQAATITVTTTTNTIADDGECSLREAIDNANADSNANNRTADPSKNRAVNNPAGEPRSHDDCAAGNGDDTIVLSDATYRFKPSDYDGSDGHLPAGEADNWWYGPNALPAIASAITIEGNGAELVITDNAGTGSPTRLRFFFVAADPTSNSTKGYHGPRDGVGSQPGGNLTLKNLTLIGGRQQGGSGATGGAGLGGGIYNQGRLLLSAVTLQDNHATGGGKIDGANNNSGDGKGGGGLGEDVNPNNGHGGGFGGPVPSGMQDHGADGTETDAGNGGGATDASAGKGGGAEGFSIVRVHPGVSGNGAGGGGGSERSGSYANASGGGGGGFGGGNGGLSYQGIVPFPNDGKGGAFGNGGVAGFVDNAAAGGGGGGVGGGGGYGRWAGGGGGFGGGGGIGDAPFNGGDAGFGGGVNLNGRIPQPGFGGGIDFNSNGAGGAGMGGALFSHGGTAIIENSTFSNNHALGGSVSGPQGHGTGFGGALFNLNGSVSIVHSSFSGNQVDRGDNKDGSAIYSLGYSLFDGVVANTPQQTATLSIENSIVHGNFNAPNEVVNNAPDKVSNGSDNQAAASLSLSGLNFIGSLAGTQGNATLIGAASVNTADPLLGTLRDNGGFTHTFALLPGSPAIDAAADCASLTTDQRGQTRPLDGDGDANALCDIGALEALIPGIIRVDLQENSANLGEVGKTSNALCSLHEAIENANAPGTGPNPECEAGLLLAATTIELPAVGGGAQFRLMGTNVLPVITGSVIINGHGSRICRADTSSCLGNPTDIGDTSAFRILQANGADVVLNDLILSQGYANGAAEVGKGGGLYATASRVYLNRSSMDNNVASGDGGGIWGDGITIHHSTLSSNTASGDGGGIWGEKLNINHSTISGNTATNNAGGIYANSLSLNHSSIVNNTAGVKGGGIRFNAGVHRMHNSLFADNTAGDSDPDCSAFSHLIVTGHNLSDAGNCFTTTAADMKLQANGGKLGPLAHNGGPTQTHALLAGASAIDTATDGGIFDNCGAGINNRDQRGVPRPVDVAGVSDGSDECDVGAFEYIDAPILDLGDAPDGVGTAPQDKYPTLLANNGAAHGATGPKLGAERDVESSGSPSPNADGDDGTGATPDDEDGVTLPVLAAGQTATINVTGMASATDTVSAWIDYNRDGVWDNNEERIAHKQTGLDNAPLVLTPTVPLTAVGGDSFARFRVCSTNTSCDKPSGIATDGEVEDYKVEIQPAVSFTAASQASTDESGTMTVTARLSAVSSKTVDVPFAVSGDAGNPADFTITNSPITIAAGDQTADITITITTDMVDENNETVVITMGDPSNAAKGTTTVHTATITDDDNAPTVTLSLAGSPFSETAGMATVTATLSNPSVTPVVVNLGYSGTASAGDYTASANQVTIAAGSSTGSITLKGVDDALVEGDETVITSISSLTGGTTGTPSQVTATLTEDDALPVITIAAVDGAASTAKVGNAHVVMLAADIAVPAYPEALTVTSLDLTASGSGNDQADVTSVKLWRDNGDGTFGSGDTVIASGIYNADNSTLTLTSNVTIPAGTTTRFFVTYDYSTSLASLALPMMAGLPLLIGFGLMGMGGRRTRSFVLIALIVTAPVALTGCPGAGEAAVVYALTQDDDDDSGGSSSTSGTQTETFRVTPTAVTASFPSGIPTTTGLPITGPSVTVSE